jgi:hypothetical protein
LKLCDDERLVVNPTPEVSERRKLVSPPAVAVKVLNPDIGR